MIIKVCGMREKENIRAVASLGVDMIGIIFFPKSPRYVQPMRDGDKGLPALPRVGVFVDETIDNILKIVQAYHLDYIQLHGNESPLFVTSLRDTLKEEHLSEVRLIKALRVRTEEEVGKWQAYKGLIDLLLFDTPCTSYGGSGQHFNWSLLEHYHGDIPFLLSGGIGPDDLAEILAFCHPMMRGVDLNSRFETSPGLKDLTLLREFIHQLRYGSSDR